MINEDFTSALVVAEVVEVFQALQGGGWNCGASNGEGLSRVLAEELYPGVLDGFSTASDWLDTDRPDWVNQNAGSDGDTGANGCSVLFLFWLHYQLGYTWQQICQAPGSTLAETYRQLAGVNTDPFPDFSRLLGQNYSPGAPSNLTHDNPFPLGARQFATAIPSKGTRLIPRASLVRS
ncbi:MAG TPA: hypothetical protein VHR45_09460 [Thermoanaerobaculia bacterium]|nr:hypothetical protein [Thermoanaerobaculia bacterium]